MQNRTCDLRCRHSAGDHGFLTLFDAKTAKILFTATALVVILGLIYVLRQSLLVFLFAVFFAYLMEPLVARLDILLFGRGRAIAVLG